MAATGAVVNHSGCWLQVAEPLISAIGLSPADRQCSRDATRSAAAPSLMLEAFPAVIVPSGANAGFRVRKLGFVELCRSFVRATTWRVGLPFRGDLDGHDLGSKAPLAIACTGARVASDREIVLLGPAEVIFVRAELAAGSHVLSGRRRPRDRRGSWSREVRHGPADSPRAPW